MTTPPLGARFTAHLGELGLGAEPAHLLVAVSGGRDSVALLHLLRAAAGALPLTLTVAHLDHAMRPGSAADARWVRGLCTAWDLPLVNERLEQPPAGETEAREARYEFLRRARSEVGADLIATAHHADDQAETVLFRAVRGAGLRGLSGMRALTASGLLRPLLPFWRAEIDRYVRHAGLRWREDPTNLSIGPARNRIRHRLLPELEREIAPGARRNLATLAELAREAESALAPLVRRAEAAVVRREGEEVVVGRAALAAHSPAVATRVLRRALGTLGPPPDAAGTRVALQFITDAPSGRELHLPRGVRVRIEFGEARLVTAGAAAEDEPAVIPGPPAGDVELSLRLGSAAYRVVYGTAEAPTGAREADRWSVALDPDSLRFPLRLRGWCPGDRVRTSGGTKSLKKLFVEERIPRSSRGRLPVLVDADGRVLWVAGIRRALLPGPPAAGTALVLKIVND